MAQFSRVTGYSWLQADDATSFSRVNNQSWSQLTVAAGGSFELLSTPGSYSVTGSNTTLLATRRLDSSPGSYTITGASTELIYTPVGSFELIVTPGSYTITGATADLSVASPNKELISIPGSYVITGAQATLTYSGENAPVSRTGGVYVDWRRIALEKFRRELKYLYEEDNDEEVKEAALEILQDPEVDSKEIDTLLKLIRKQLTLVQNTLTEKVNYEKVIVAAEEVKRQVKRKKQQEAAVMFLL